MHLLHRTRSAKRSNESSRFVTLVDSEPLYAPLPNDSYYGVNTTDMYPRASSSITQNSYTRRFHTEMTIQEENKKETIRTFFVNMTSAISKTIAASAQATAEKCQSLYAALKAKLDEPQTQRFITAAASTTKQVIIVGAQGTYQAGSSAYYKLKSKYSRQDVQEAVTKSAVIICQIIIAIAYLLVRAGQALYHGTQNYLEDKKEQENVVDTSPSAKTCINDTISLTILEDQFEENEAGQFDSTPKKLVKGSDKHQWRLICIPAGDFASSNQHVSLIVEASTTLTEPVTLRGVIKIVGTNFEKKFNMFVEENTKLSFSKLISHDELRRIGGVIDKRVTFSCLGFFESQ